MLKILPLLTFFFFSCSATTKLPPPKHRQPDKSAKVFYPRVWNINSESDLRLVQKNLGAEVIKKDGVLILDLKGGILDGSKQKGNGSQNENQEPLFRANIPFQLKNGFVRNNKNAATFAASDSGIYKITFLNIGEDAVATSRKAENFTVSNCEFINSLKGDKSIQLNQADNATIEKNIIYGGITGVRVHESSWATEQSIAYCSQNEFFGVDTAWNVAKGTLVVEKPNKYKGVRIPFKISKNGNIENADGNVKNE